MRVGVAMISHESSTFVDDPITIESFERDTLATGPPVREKFADSHHEVGGFFAGLDESGIEAVPLLAARIIPGGVVTAGAHERLVALLFEQLDAAPDLDGLLVAPHGAAVCESAPDMDGDWLGRLRERVGPDVPVIATLDLHASLSPRMVEATDAIIAYRTYPHLDQHARGLEAARLMARTLSGAVRPVQRACHPPMVINLERQITAEPPCRALCALADEIRARPGVLAVSTVLGFPYADVAEMGTSFTVTTDGYAESAQAGADELGEHLWRHRESFVANLIGVDDAVGSLATAPLPALLLDLGDNIGCATPGDGTLIAHALLRRRDAWRRAFVCLCDPSSVQRAGRAGVGAVLEMELGGRREPYGPPLTGRFRIAGLTDGRFSEPEPRHSAFTDYNMGPTAVVELEEGGGGGGAGRRGGLTVMLNSVATMPFSLRQLTSCGIDPADFDVFIAKGAQAPIAAYGSLCPTKIRVNTPGASTAEIAGLTYHHRRRPMFPFEPEAAWTAARTARP